MLIVLYLLPAGFCVVELFIITASLLSFPCGDTILLAQNFILYILLLRFLITFLFLQTYGLRRPL